MLWDPVLCKHCFFPSSWTAAMWRKGVSSLTKHCCETTCMWVFLGRDVHLEYLSPISSLLSSSLRLNPSSFPSGGSSTKKDYPTIPVPPYNFVVQVESWEEDELDHLVISHCLISRSISLFLEPSHRRWILPSRSTHEHAWTNPVSWFMSVVSASNRSSPGW
jgi:hypothetical protein